MDIDPRYCFDCDRRLGDPPPDNRGLRRCADCQADVDAYTAALGDLEAMPPPRFHGSIALGAPLPGWPTTITLLALEVWDRFSELSYVEAPGANPPQPHPRDAATNLLGDQPPRKWVITTDTATAHHGDRGGGGTPGTDQLLAWETYIAPTLPPETRRLDIHAQSPGATATTSLDLSNRPLTLQTATVTHHPPPPDADPNCASCGPPPPAPPDSKAPPGQPLHGGVPPPPHPDHDAHLPDRRPTCNTCRANQRAVLAAKVPTRPQPDQVTALGAQLGPLLDTELVIPTLVQWPTWFDLTIVGHQRGPWSTALHHPQRASRWSAHDDHGRLYHGASTGSASGLGLASKSLTFTPALAGEATALTIAIPAAINGQAHHATIDLHPTATHPA